MNENDSTPETPESDLPPPQYEGSKQAFEDLKKAAKKAWEETKREACQSADDAMPKIKDEFKRAANELIYELAYAAQYASTLVKSAVPDSAVDAGNKGAADGEEAAEEFLRKRKEQGQEPPEGDTEPAAG